MVVVHRATWLHQSACFCCCPRRTSWIQKRIQKNVLVGSESPILVCDHGKNKPRSNSLAGDFLSMGLRMCCIEIGKLIDGISAFSMRPEKRPCVCNVMKTSFSLKRYMAWGIPGLCTSPGSIEIHSCHKYRLS